MSRNPSPGKVDAKGTTRACNQVEATRKPTPTPRHQGWDQGYDHDFHQNCDILWCSQRITISRSSSFDHSVLVQPAEDPKVAVVIFNHGCAYETSSRDLKNSYQPQCVEKLRIQASRPAMVVLHPHEHPFSCSPRTFAFFFPNSHRRCQPLNQWQATTLQCKFADFKLLHLRVTHGLMPFFSRWISHTDTDVSITG